MRSESQGFRRRGRGEKRKEDRREKNGLLDRGALLSDSLVGEPGGARARGKNAASRAELCVKNARVLFVYDSRIQLYRLFRFFDF